MGMIPHHQNAVNMCKLLINQHLECAELTPDRALGVEDLDCTMSLLCSEIINVQNHQIQTMQGIYGYESKSCSGNSAKKSKTAKGGKSDKSAKDDKAAKGGLKGSSAFELPNPNCPMNFVCGAGSELKNFAAYFNALDCAMISGMSNEVGSKDANVSDEIALFINQMIPHHQNAVNMCKTLINQHLKCAKLTPESAEKDINCTMSLLCSEIINVQNHQIQTMQGIYDFKSKSCSGESAKKSSGKGAKESKTAKGGKSDKSAKDDKAAKGGL